MSRSIDYQVHLVTPESLYGRSADFPVIAYVGIDSEGHVLASGGVCWRWGMAIMWVDHVDPVRCPVVPLMRWCRRMIGIAQRYGDNELWTILDDRIPTARRLNAHLGFEPAGRLIVDGEDKGEVWKWQLSR